MQIFSKGNIPTRLSPYTLFWGTLCCCLFWTTSGCDNLARIGPVDAKGFVKFYGGAANQMGADIKLTTDGGYIMVGSTASFGAGQSDMFVVKADSLGNAEWTRTLGGEYADKGVAVRLTPAQGGYIVVGDLGTNTAGDSTKIMLEKLDEFGETTWSYVIAENRNSIEYSADLELLADTGFIVIGTTTDVDTNKNGWNPATDFKDIYVAKIRAPKNVNDTVSLTFEQQHGFAKGDEGVGVRPFLDGRYDILGNTIQPGESESKILFSNISINGLPLISTKIIGTSGDVKARHWNIDGNQYLVAGSRQTASVTNFYWVILDDQGNPETDREFTIVLENRNDELSDVIAIDEGYLLSGTTESLSESGKKDFYLRAVPTDPNQSPLWEKATGSEDDDVMERVVSVKGGYAFIGTGGFSNNTNLNLTKVNQLGEL